MNIWERIIREVQGAAGGFNAVGDGRFGALPWNPSNFETQDTETPFPYDRAQGVNADTNASDNLGAPSGHQRGRGRPDVSGQSPKAGDDPYGLHKSGGAPVPSGKYQATWDSIQEVMGQPTATGPWVPFDGPSMHSARNARPVRDKNNKPVPSTDEYRGPGWQNVETNSGPGNMWGGPQTIPGDANAHMAPAEGSEEEEVKKWKPPEENKMNLREFFDPETPPTEEVENPEQTHEKDQTDDEVENKLDRVYGQEDNHEFDGGKESDDDSTKMSKSSGGDDTGMEVFGEPEPPGTPDEEVEDAQHRAAPGVIPPPQPDQRAGVIMLDDEPAGIVNMGDEMGGAPQMGGNELGGEEPMGAPGPVSAQVDAQDFQLTVEPEAGQMPALSQMLGQDSPSGPADGAPDDVMAMRQQAQGLLPKKSSWDEIAIQVGDAVVNLRKTGGQQPMPAPMPQQGPPMPQKGPPAGPPEEETPTMAEWRSFLGRTAVSEGWKDFVLPTVAAAGIGGAMMTAPEKQEDYGSIVDQMYADKQRYLDACAKYTPEQLRAMFDSGKMDVTDMCMDASVKASKGRAQDVTDRINKHMKKSRKR